MKKKWSDNIRNTLWYNSEILENTLFFSKWYKKGILLVADIIDSDFRILSLRDLKNKFNIHINILNYYTVRTKINSSQEKSSPMKNWNLERPVYPDH